MPNTILLFAAVLLGQSAASLKVIARPLTASEITASASLLDKAQVPDLSGKLQVQRTQVFAVKSSSSSFVFEPVLYEANNSDTGNTSPRCGIFFLTEKTKATFVPTLGSFWTEAETCTDLEGVGFSETGAEMPRILLLYAASSPNYSTREPIVLDWDSAAHRYQGNRELSSALTHKGGNASIAAMKRRISEIAAEQK